jgi:excisionase family DNA binding protein
MPWPFGPNTEKEQNRIVPISVEDPFEFPNIAEIMKTATEAIDNAKSTNYKIRHINNAIEKLDGLRNQGLDKFRKLEEAGLEPFGHDPFTDTIHEIEYDIQILSNKRDTLQLFEEEKKELHPTPVLSVGTIRAMELAAKTFLTPDEAAEYTTLKKDYVYSLLAKGKFPGSKVGSRWIIDRKEVEDWVRSQKPKH